MKFESNLNIVDVITRHFAGMLVCIAGGFLGYYVAPVFYMLVPLGPVWIFTAIVGWSPAFALLHINHIHQSQQVTG